MKNAKLLFLLTALFSAPAALTAATLNAVPMQGGMVMPMIAYRATEARLRVMVDPAVPQLTPLLVSNPGDGFDPADPWFDALDPSRQGLAFSRRYGFVMDTMTDPLPAGTAIWIRKISSSPGLGAYRYQNTAPKVFEPIFGTAGSSNALSWNGMMFHPTFAAPPGVGTYTATFEAYLVNTGTGAEVPGSSTGPFVFNWTDVSDGRIVVGIAQRLVITWPISNAKTVLEAASSLPATNWTVVTNTPVLLEGQSAVILEASEAKKFYRVRAIP